MFLRDAISIPEHVSASDFVIKLDAGVEQAESTIHQYRVTEKLAVAFDVALASLASALTSGGDRGSFVHGSFGSGKSHFMAMLHLLISGNPSARALPGLQHAIASNEVALKAQVLTLDFHLIGAASFEDALFSGYLRQIALLHPDAGLPMLHNSEALFLDANAMRSRLGDEVFFGGLNSETSAWGSFGGGWDAAKYDAAATSNTEDDTRGRLASALVASYFSGYVQAGEWVGIDTGLKLITSHAKSLGYQAVVFFLDELVLWLASHLADSEFVSTEGIKVSKLVEAGAGARAIPIVSFVARQRELKDFLAESVPGAERVAVGQTFTWWETRFDIIKLEASDLPEIVNYRLLQPSNDAGASAMASALAVVKLHAKAWDTLLTDEGGSDEAAFAKVYPFSPALVDTLVALSTLLQRERTALKVMAQLLVGGRDWLTVTDVIPVGDLYDVVVEGGDTPLTPEMQTHFNVARELYRAKLRPMLLTSHGLKEADLAGSHAGSIAPGAAASAAFYTDDRLVKTLLVAALVPGASALRNLTASRLAFLNYGTIPTVIPGTEVISVLSRVKTWAEQVGELQIGDGADPLISLSVTGVNYDSVLEQVRTEDTTATRRSLLRQMVFEQMGIASNDTLLAANPHSFVWRGSKRTIDLVYGNVRDADALPDDALRAAGGNWKLVIDYPFDVAEHGPNDDIARIERLRDSGVTSRTVAWIPAFLSASRQDDLGTLVLLEYLLAGTGDAFVRHAAHLPSEQRQLAKTALSNRRNSLRSALNEVIKQAYGAATREPRDIDTSYGAISPFATLDPGLSLQPLVGATLGDAMANLVDQMLSSQFPSHPRFEPSDSEVKRAELNVALEHVTRAMAGSGRVEPVENSKRTQLRRVANPLNIGEMLENHYVFSATSFPWRNQFTSWASAENLTSVPMTRVRNWLEPWGLAREVENLLALSWALLDDKQWSKAGAPVSVAGVEQVTDDLVLSQPTLPEQDAWDSASERASALFGITVSHLRSAANVIALGNGVRARAHELVNGTAELVNELERHAHQLGLAELAPRMQLALLGKQLVSRLSVERDDVVLVQTLAEFQVPAEAQPLAKSMSTASSVAGALQALQWQLVDSIRGIAPDDGRHSDATELLNQLAAAAAANELHQPLAPAVTAAVNQAASILTVAPPVVVAPVVTVPVVAPTPVAPPVVEQGLPAAKHVDDIQLDGFDDAFASVIDEARAALKAHPGRNLHVQWWLE